LKINEIFLLLRKITYDTKTSRSMKKLIVLTFITFLLGFTSCQENSYKDGKKHGKWVEYLDESWSKEVSKDSSTYYRVIKYNNGYPEGLVKDYFTKSGSLQGEGYLISGPYLQNTERPKDKMR